VKQLRYFGLVDLGEVLAPALVDVDPYVGFSVSACDGGQELWDRCLRLRQANGSPTFRFRLGSLLWNDRMMAATENFEG